MKRIVLLITGLLLLLPLALAATKPVTAQTNVNNQQATLFVEIEFLGSKTLCVSNPNPTTSNQGIFASNLGNLVLQQNPQTKCDGLWSVGDRIWYEVAGKTSNNAVIERGTGLQELPSLTTKENTQPPSTPGSSSSSSGGGGSVSSTPDQRNINSPTPDEKEHLTQIELGLDENIVSARTNTNTNIRIILFEKPSNRIIATFEENNVQEFSVDIKKDQLEAGRYSLQAFAIENQKIIASSQAITFFTTGSTHAIPEPKEQSFVGKVIQEPLQSAKRQPVLIGIITFSICFIILGVVVFLLARRQKEQRWG